MVDALRNTAQSASNMVAENVSIPIDAIAWALRKAGVPVDKPMFGSDWLKEKGVITPVEQGPSKVIGDTIGMLGPMGFTKMGRDAIMEAGSKLRNVPAGMSIKDVSAPPQAEALQLAQQRAALPVEQGGLGLPPTNTAMERAAAMGFDAPAFHGTNKSFDAFKVGKGGVDELGAGAYTTEAPYAANMWATGEGGNVMPMMVKSKDVFDRSNINKDSYLDIAARIKQNPESLPPLVRSWADESVEDLAKYIEQTSKQGGLNTWLERAQYIGAKDQGSQIPLQQVTFNPENIRSRFAAFDPFRKTAATAAAMGVAAPNLMAQERDNANR
jgi:hypothetical protein